MHASPPDFPPCRNSSPIFPPSRFPFVISLLPSLRALPVPSRPHHLLLVCSRPATCASPPCLLPPSGHLRISSLSAPALPPAPSPPLPPSTSCSRPTAFSPCQSPPRPIRLLLLPLPIPLSCLLLPISPFRSPLPVSSPPDPSPPSPPSYPPFWPPPYNLPISISPASLPIPISPREFSTASLGSSPASLPLLFNDVDGITFLTCISTSSSSAMDYWGDCPTSLLHMILNGLVLLGALIS